jgi:membrane protein DedA with SNARE-associated domain/rhodanese-related sulfurtransferase
LQKARERLPAKGKAAMFFQSVPEAVIVRASMTTAPHAWWNLGYYGIFLWVFVEQLGAPIPAFPILMAAGALVASHELSLPSCLGTAVVAALLADSIWYAVGWIRGGSVLNLMCRVSWRPDTCVSKTKVIFFKHGTKILIFAKFIPGLSTLTPPLAGMARIFWGRFLLYDGIGAFLWALLPLVAGAYLQKSFAALASRAGEWKGALPWLCGAVVAFVLVWRYRSRQAYRDGLEKGRAAGIDVAQLRARLDGGEELVVLDVRDAMSVRAKPVALPNALWIPYTALPERLAELPPGKSVVLYCDCPTDESSVAMADFLRQRDRAAHPLLGGLEAWIGQGWATSPLEIGEAAPIGA